MNQMRNQTLIVQYFATFASTKVSETFEQTLRAARLVVEANTVRFLGATAREHAASQIHLWLREAIAGWEGPIVLFAWFHESLDGTCQALGALERHVPGIRRARKVVLVPEVGWPIVAKFAGVPIESSWFDVPYQGMQVDGSEDTRPALVLKLSAEPDYKMAVQLGVFLGTRRRESVMNMPAVGGGIPASATDTAPEPFQFGVSSKPPRDAEPTVNVATGLHPKITNEKEPPSRPGHRIGRTGPRSSQVAVEIPCPRPDPRTEEDDRPTLPPAPGEGPPEPIPSRKDPTQPK